MLNEPVTFDYLDATYTVRPMMANEAQRVINIALSICHQVCLDMGIPLTGDEDLSSSYPYDIYNRATQFVRYFLTTKVEGNPKHLVPKTSLHLSRYQDFMKWMEYADAHPELLQWWDDAIATANKAEDNPLAESAEIETESN